MKALICSAVAVLAAFGGVGCGGDDAPAAKPKPKGDPRPRVEGEWRVVYTPQDTSQPEDRATWTATPSCKYGACGFRVESNKGIKLRLRFDDAIGDYTDRNRSFGPCVNAETNETVIEDAYAYLDQVTLTTSSGVKNSRGAFAIEMTGTRVQRGELRPEHLNSDCDPEDEGQRIDMQLVRVDPPRGRRFYGDDPNAPQPVVD